MTANAVEQLKEMVAGASNVVAFTGAGISTECGIPDFRSPGGFWTKNRPIDFREFVSDPASRREAWSRFLKLRDEHLDVQPGRGHMALARLNATGKMSHVITQNIDNLHQDSGLPVDAIIELHGNGTYAKCLDCGTRHELDWCAEEPPIVGAEPGKPPGSRSGPAARMKPWWSETAPSS